MRLHTQSYGQQGPAVVILHGLFGMSDNWHSIARQLGDNFRVLVPDQRNHGRSPSSPAMDYDLMADDIKELLDLQGIERAAIVGHSMGGKAGMRFALSHPDRTSGLVVIDVAMRRYEPKHLHIFDAFENFPLDRVKNRNDAENGLFELLKDKATVQFLLKNITRKDDGAYTWKIDHRVIRQNYEHINGPIEGGSSFSGPALLIRGENSSYVADEDIAALRDKFPSLVAETVAGAGHWVHADRPLEVSNLLKKFLGTLSL